MKQLFILAISIFTFQHSFGQGIKNSSKSFSVMQDNDQEELLTMKVPEKTDITSSTSYAIYSEGKNSLTIDYELDDDPNVTMGKAFATGDMDLVKYSVELPDKKIAGTTDYSISNKKIDGAIKMINGLPTIKITYNYIHTIAGQNITETGKAVLYLIKLKGTSLLNTDEHEIIVRLKFDEQQASGNSMDNIATEISKTIMHAKA